MNSLKNILIVILVVALGAVGWLLYRSLDPIGINSWQIRYTQLPPNDQPLQDWLRSQPGVTAATVSREGNLIIVSYVLKPRHANVHGDLVDQAKDLGYSGFGGITGQQVGYAWWR